MGGSKTSTTEIGVEMEIDRYVTNKDQDGRFKEYLSKYGAYISGPTKRITAFYGEEASVLVSNLTVRTKVANFFKSGI